MAITPLPNVPGGYLSRVVGTWESLPMGIQMAWRAGLAPAPGAADIAVALSLSNNIATAWPAFATAALSTTYGGSLVATYPLHTPTAPAQDASLTSPGGQPGDPAPSGVAILMKHQVLRRGRGSQGRTFLSAFPDSAVTADGKSISTAFANSIDSAWSTMITSIQNGVITDTGTVVVLAQLSKKGVGAVYDITSSLTEHLLSSQKRRTPRR